MFCVFYLGEGGSARSSELNVKRNAVSWCRSTFMNQLDCCASVLTHKLGLPIQATVNEQYFSFVLNCIYYMINLCDRIESIDR